MRLKPKVVIDTNVCNQSAREGALPTLVVLHSTESGQVPGNGDLQAVVNWFDTPSAQASSHVITDADGNSARCVGDSEKSWACAGFNSVSLNIEQIGFASQGKWDEAELKETARWIARWSIKFDIPIKRGKVAAGAVVEPGVVTHSQLGSVGGGHSDPGDAYPINHVLELAHDIRKQLRKDG